LRSRSNEYIRIESNQVGDGSWQSIRGLGKAILDHQIFSLHPAETSQRIKEYTLGLIEGLPGPIAYGKKAKPTASPLRPRAPWRNEQHRSSRYELPPLHSILIAA
jgi:hypothetical protein